MAGNCRTGPLPTPGAGNAGHSVQLPRRQAAAQTQIGCRHRESSKKDTGKTRQTHSKSCTDLRAAAHNTAVRHTTNDKMCRELHTLVSGIGLCAKLAKLMRCHLQPQQTVSKPGCQHGHNYANECAASIHGTMHFMFQCCCSSDMQSNACYIRLSIGTQS